MFTPKHRHTWQPLAVAFQPPREHINVERANGELAQMLLLGASTITQRCLDCGWIETALVPGKAIVPTTPQED